MNILISSSKLADVARTAVRAVRHCRDRKFPILNCCRLTAGGNLSIYGTDLDTGIAAAAECDVIESGEAAVDAQRLADIAAKLKGDVCISHTAKDLVIKCGRSRFTLTTQPLEDAPTPLAADSHAPPIAFGAADVMALFAGAATGAASGDARPYLNGVAIFSEPRDFGHRLCAVGTDSTCRGSRGCMTDIVAATNAKNVRKMPAKSAQLQGRSRQAISTSPITPDGTNTSHASTVRSGWK